MPLEVLTKVYKPMRTVGPVYARPYGGTGQPLPIGNVLALNLEHTEDVQRQEDYSRLGGGTHAEVRRVTDVKLSMKLADLNLVNLTRATQGTLAGVTGAAVVDEPFTLASLGGLLPLANIAPTSVTVKKGPAAASATVVPMAGNYEIRGEGIYVLETATGVAAADKLWVSYSYGDYATVEALTTKAAELELIFGGMNEAETGKPVVINIWRCSQGVTKQLAMLGTGFNGLDIEGTVLKDPLKTGSGISPYYRARLT
jgi:hypothetical protein